MAAVLAVLLALVVVNSFVNKGDKSPLNPNPVAQAAERLEAVPGAHFSIYVVYSTPALPRPLNATGSGVYNAQTDRSRATFDLESPAGGSLHIVSISDGDVEYTSGDTVAAKLPPGKEWVRTDSESPEDSGSLDMDSSLKVLGSVDKAELIGRETINGKATRRYRSAIGLGQFIEFLREEGKEESADAYERIEDTSPTEISAEAWIDSKNLLRRLRMVMPTPAGPGDTALTVDMRMDLFDYGARPDIQIPDPDSVVEGPLDSGEASSASTSIS